MNRLNQRKSQFFQRMVRLQLFWIACSLPGAVVNWQVAATGGSGSEKQFHYKFFVSQTDLAQNQELLIQFDESLFSSLANGTAGPGFSVLLFQPNQPPQAPGALSAFALIDHPSLTQPLEVDAVYAGSGTPMGSQMFAINQYFADGRFDRVLETGLTAASPLGAVPEPASLLLLSLGLSAGAIYFVPRSRNNQKENN